MDKKKVIKTNPEVIREIIKKSALYVINEMGLLRDDELMEYARLRNEDTGVGVDVFVDDGGAYKRYNHPLWVYVRNGYRATDPFFHIEVSENPSAPNIEYNISEANVQAVLQFIRQNASLLKAFADEQIGHNEFYSVCKPVIFSYVGSSQLNEMATLRPKQSGLPTTLWIDEGTSPQHARRIKFQASKEQAVTLEFSSMSISQEPEVFNLPKKKGPYK